MKTSSLTNEQRESRKNGIGGTDAKKIMDGNWHDLWLEKTGRVQADDLSKIFKVQLGIYTESFNLDWLELVTGWNVITPEVGKTYLMDEYPVARCHPDAFAKRQDGITVLIDAKHTAAKAAWWNEEKLIGYYYWQMQHNMMVTGTEESYLSVIWGNEFGDPIHIKANPEDQKRLLQAEKTFWWHVENDDEPENPEAYEAPVIELDDMRTVDMSGNNEFADLAVDWIENKKPATKFKKVDKELKDMLEDDVKLMTGYGIEVKRNAKGRTIKETKK